MKLLFILVIINIYVSIHFHTLALDSALSQLKYYEVIPSLPPTRNKRDILGVKRITINAFGKEYILHLKRANSILTKDFHISTLDAAGNFHKYYNFREPEAYEGFLSNDPSSSVTAYFDDFNRMTVVIDTKDDTIMIENLAQYDDHQPINNGSLIIYRQSDLISDPSMNKSMCGNAIPPTFSTNSRKNKEEFIKKGHTRTKRDATRKDTCELLLVADYRFHNKYGRGNKALTSNYLIELIGRINRIYRKTHFITEVNENLTNYGFAIKHILIHDTATTDGDSLYQYNAQKRDLPDVWDTEKLLKAFGRVDYGDYCLAHLFTYQQFTQGILGLAWIASPMYGNPGGICTKGEYLSDHIYYLNTGWTTFKDGAGKSLLTLMAHLVTAHEFGHNWGSNHDPDKDECSPRSDESGKYIMYTYSVSGYEPNNKLFSPCSRRAMGEVLNSRAHHCFTSESKSENFCGNKRTDAGEECDVGREGDECCTSDCHLRANATCSKFNSLCCSETCQLAKAGTTCAAADQENPCEGESLCTGDLVTCPAPAKNDSASCAEQGTCFNRECVPYCEFRKMRSCICDDVEDSCLICCMNNKSQCLPTDKINPEYNRFRLNDGRPCLIGFCREGKCQRSVNKLVERFWDIIKQLHPNAFAMFLKNNLVCAVIFFSLIVWVPCCLLVWWGDKKMKEANKSKGAYHTVAPSIHRETRL